MLRYYLIATLLVAAAIGALVLLRREPGPELKISGVRASGSPSAPRVEATSAITPGPFRGDAPWALSALPGCFVQELKASGALVSANMPAGARRLAPGERLRAGECSIEVRRHDLVVVRGDDRFHVPPSAELYSVPGGKAALIERRRGRTELRVYRLVR